jgi:hypothetical protein
MRSTIEMAREQGLPETEVEGVFRVNADDLGRFAALVEQRTHTNNKARWYQEGVESEREAIIKFLGHGVDLSGLAGEPQMQMFCATLLKGCADSIRSRGNT